MPSISRVQLNLSVEPEIKESLRNSTFGKLYYQELLSTLGSIQKINNKLNIVLDEYPIDPCLN